MIPAIPPTYTHHPARSYLPSPTRTALYCAARKVYKCDRAHEVDEAINRRIGFDSDHLSDESAAALIAELRAEYAAGLADGTIAPPVAYVQPVVQSVSADAVLAEAIEEEMAIEADQARRARGRYGLAGDGLRQRGYEVNA